MNRRAAIRMARRDLRRAGCTCCPKVSPFSAAGAAVEHEPGCALGDRVAAWNRLGILPALFVSGCDR